MTYMSQNLGYSKQFFNFLVFQLIYLQRKKTTTLFPFYGCFEVLEVGRPPSLHLNLQLQAPEAPVSGLRLNLDITFSQKKPFGRIETSLILPLSMNNFGLNCIIQVRILLGQWPLPCSADLNYTELTEVLRKAQSCNHHHFS